jgi:hypothetical protein
VVRTLSDSYVAEITSHRKWLSVFEPERLRRWEQLLASNEEAALCEACVREFLQKHVDRMEPAEQLDSGGPDFACSVGEERFYVEATCLTMDVVSKHTGLPANFDPNAGPRNYCDLTALIKAEASNKTPQCSGLDAPCLLAVGTFHFEASGLCGDEHHSANVLTSNTGISMRFDPELGEAVGDMVPSTDLRHSSVLRKGKTSLVESARRPISGFLVCGFGCTVRGGEWPVLGAMHPDAARPFTRALLPAVRFCELEPGFEHGVLTPRWT